MTASTSDASGPSGRPHSPWPLVGLGVLLRLAMPAVVLLVHGTLRGYLTGDSDHYLRLAASLLQTGSYGTETGPELFRPPGFPLLLVPAVASGFVLEAVVALHALLGGLTVLLSYRTAERIGGGRAASWAGLLCAVEPGQVLDSGYVMADPLLTVMVTATAYVGVRCLQAGTTGWLVGLGLLVAAAAYVKTVAYFLPLWLAGLLWLASSGPLTARTRRMAVVVAVAAAALGAWHLRNQLTAGFPGFSTQIERAMVYGDAAAVRAASTGEPFTASRQREAAALGTTTHDFASDKTVAPGMRRRLWDAVREAPWTFLAIRVRGAVAVLLDPGAGLALAPFELPDVRTASVATTAVVHGVRAAVDAALRRGARWLVTESLLLVVLGSYLLLACRGLGRGPEPRLRLWLLGLAIYFVAASSGPFASARFRVPIMPVLSVLAGLGLTRQRGAAGGRIISWQ